MGLDVRDCLGVKTGHRLCSGNHLGLAFRARRRVTGASAAVIIQRKTADHCQHIVAIGDGIVQAPQQHHACPMTEDRSLRILVEWTDHSVA